MSSSSSSNAGGGGRQHSQADIDGGRVCGRCRNDDSNYLDGEARLAYSARCGHALCHRCLQETFGRHRSNRCPVATCGETLTRADFTDESRELLEYRREKDVRRRMSLVFNRSLADFRGNAALYNDYLERVEWYIAALVTGSNVEKTEAEIEAYRAENARVIAINNARNDAEMKRAAEALRAERAVRQAAAARAEEEHATRRAATERLRARIASVLGAVQADLRSLSQAQRDALKGELAEIRRKLQAATTALADAAARRDAAVAALGAEGGVDATASGGVAGGGVEMYIPCPSVFPPRFLADVYSDAAAAAAESASASSGGVGAAYGGSAAASIFDSVTPMVRDSLNGARRHRTLRACGVPRAAADRRLPPELWCGRAAAASRLGGAQPEWRARVGAGSGVGGRGGLVAGELGMVPGAPR